MFAHCRGPIWRVDDFSTCFQHDYLETLYPLLVVAVSLVYLSVQIASVLRSSEYYKSHKRLDGSANQSNGWNSRTSFTETGIPPYRDDETDTEDEFVAIHEQPTLERLKTHESVVQLNKPKGELVLVVVEEAAVLAQVAIHLLIVIDGTWGKSGRVAAVAMLVTWAYVAVLASLRLLFSSSSKLSFPKLWYHTAFVYCALWVVAALIFRSEIVHPRSTFARSLQSADFALLSLLSLVALTSRKGNKAVKLEYEGDLKPSKEQTASVFSLATFSWVDSIVWQGYKKTYEITDVWNLAPKDKAQNVLQEYRQFKKTSILAWHLLAYFKRELIIQALWASITGVLTFAPTLLLKVILEYVQRPDSTPKNAAWLYVILLFVSGCLEALANGQCLWVGRKICIRLRAIIVGEIYSKALRRKASTKTDKILGAVDQTDASKHTLLQKMNPFSKKKKQQDAKPKEEAENAKKDEQVTSGTIINLMAVDSFKVSEICSYLHFLWACTPVQFVMAIYLLYRIMGLSSVAGIGMMFALLPVNMIIAKMFHRIQKQILASTDSRIHITNEVLGNVRIIKFFAWQQRFMSLVNEKRTQELIHLRRRYMVWAIAATVWSGAPVLITFLSFLIYTKVEKKDLLPSVAFTALSLFQILRIPLDQFADMLAHVQESKVSVDRIEEFLNEPETEKYSQLHHAGEDPRSHPLIGFEKGTFSWGSRDDASDESFRLMDLNLEFQANQLNVIVGPTGSGKTSLLMALLGEMTLVDGSVYLPGWRSREDLKSDPETGLTESVAYCAQQAWLVNANIKENIVFASPWDPKRYQDVVEACSLARDFEILDNGDQTLVGEKGVTLSGGQKQRISLARALYSRARHVLLDDVLSAVDSHTAKWIFDQALMGPLMHNRTCILVTHNMALCLPYCEFAVVLENGKVAASGTANEIIDSGKLSEDLTKSRPGSRGPSRISSRVMTQDGEAANGAATGAATGAANGHADANTTMHLKPDEVKKVEHEETKAVGAVKLGTILLYLRAMGGWWYWGLAALTFVLQQVSSVGTNIWIRQWANAYVHDDYSIASSDSHSLSPISHVGTFSSLGSCVASGTCNWAWPIGNTTTTEQWAFSTSSTKKVDSDYYLGIYALLGLAFMGVTLLREGVLFAGSLAASRRIHQHLMERILKAKFRFFDSTPLGQIMNRFSKDIESLDQEIAPVAVGVIHCLFSILTIVVLISWITPAFLIAAAFISVLYFLIGFFYIHSSRDLKRLESLQRSPLYQQFGETLTGMTTIRAYGDERRFIRENVMKMNTANRPFIYLWAANRWLSFRVDVVGAMVAFFSGAFIILSVGRIDAGAAGLALTYAVTFTENVLWFVRLYASNEQNMNSVERIKEYLDVEQEADDIIPENRPPGNWPSKGSIEFISYSTRYRKDFDLVLKKLTFRVLPGEKVGVVGRTGAGKSSMALALFRALEAEEGKILVDDIDIGHIGLQDLRESIVMVPQDPTLFTGTIRSNLDPFGLFTDEEIFTALRGVQLIGSPGPSSSATPSGTRPATPNVQITVSDADGESPNQSTSTSNHTLVDDLAAPPTTAPPLENKNIFLNLTSAVAESGNNLSQGQRQLLCLARALLKSPKVLLMDEATASIDYATDAKIQETIREIRNTTITIAHRLQTIIDYDKVLVLDRGEVVEFGAPWDLIKDAKGVFRGMCDMTGDGEQLRDLAKKARNAKLLIPVDDDDDEGEGERDSAAK